MDASSTLAHVDESLLVCLFVCLFKSHIWRHSWDLSVGLLGLQTDIIGAARL